MATMEPIADELVRQINAGERAGFNTAEHLENARRQAVERNYSDFLIVDVDAHHYEGEAWPEIIKYIEDPVVRRREEWLGGRQRGGNDQGMSGRLVRYDGRREENYDPGLPRDVTLIRRAMKSIGIDYQIVFPTPLLLLGLNPNTRLDTLLSWAYTRWLTEEILPHDPSMKTMVYLPFNDPDACLRAIDRFADAPGVAGFMVASARYKPVHDKSFFPIYHALEERNMPLAFHSIYHTNERIFEGMNKFIAVHTLGFVLPNLVHVINWLVNGLPELFPKLKVIWIESGLAWVPFIMQRLDNNYMMRTAEAPLLKKRPSEYMRENFYYSTQPIELGDLDAVETTMRMINAESQLLFSSDFPHWDFNLPSTIYDLPFMSEEAKRAILGGNAKRVLKLDID